MRKDKKIKRFLRSAPEVEIPGKLFEKLQAGISLTGAVKASSTRPNGGGAFLKSPVIRLAAAAAVLIAVGYTVGRLTAPHPQDIEQLRVELETSLKSSLELALRRELLSEMEHRWQWALAGTCAQLRDELDHRFKRQLDAYAVHTLAASNAVTNQLLTELIEAIDATQRQQGHWVSAALEQIDLNRLQDSMSLRNDLVTFAAFTGDELQRTKRTVVNLLKEDKRDNAFSGEPEKSD